MGTLEDYNIQVTRNLEPTSRPSTGLIPAKFIPTMAAPVYGSIDRTQRANVASPRRPSTAGRSRYTPQFVRNTYDPSDPIRPASAASARSGTLPPSFNGIA